MFDFDDMPAPASSPLGMAVGDEEEQRWELDFGDGDVTAVLGVSVAPQVPPPAGKAPLCVLFVPGMPQRVFGNSRMTDPLPNEVLRRCWSIGLPTVRFDYSGCGRSTGEAPGLHDHFFMPRDAGLMLQKVLDDYCERVVLIGYSAGNNAVIRELAVGCGRGRVAAYINLSMGTRAMAMSNPQAAEALNSPEADLTLLPPEKLEMYDLVEAPSLFIRGKQDLMTPLVDIKAIIDRPARRVKAELIELRGKHAFPGAEDLPAEAIREFLLRVLR